MSKIREKFIEEGEYLLERAARFYNPDGSIKESEFGLSEFEPSLDAIALRLKKPFSSALKKLACYEDQGLPVLVEFLSNNGIPALDFFGHGTSASVFEAQYRPEAVTRYVVRIGVYGKHLSKTSLSLKPECDMNCVWGPLVLQSDISHLFSVRDSYGRNDDIRISVEVLPLAIMSPDSSQSTFGDMLNRDILVGTPYKVREDKDLGIMSDGTPVYVDPGSLNFATNHDLDMFYKKQFNPEWQQEIMSVIYENCRRLDLPDPFNWVVKQQDGRFVTKQSILYPNGGTNKPSRPNLTRVRMPLSEDNLFVR